MSTARQMPIRRLAVPGRDTSGGSAPMFRAGWFDWLRQELAPYPGRGATTARIVVTVALVVTISMALQVPEALVSAYMVLFATKENKVVTALIGLLMISGFTVAIAASLLLYRWTFDYPEFRVPAMAVILFVGYYFSRITTNGLLKFVAFGIGFVIAGTQSIGESMPTGEALVHWMLWIWVACAYPIALNVVVSQIFLPAHPHATLLRELQRRLDMTAGVIERILGLSAGDERADHTLRQLATSGSANLFKMLALTETDEPRLKSQHPAQSAAIMASERLVAAAAALALHGRESLTPEDRRCLDVLRAEAASLHAALPNPSLLQLRAEPEAADATLPEIQELQRAVASLRESLEGEIAECAEPASPAKPRKPLIAADAFTNPAHVRFALKVTLAAMTCYILYTAVDWSGIHTAFITCCFISLESTGAMRRKGTLRLAGCAIGGLVGFLCIIYLVPRMESIGSLILLIAAVSALAGWVAAGSERIAYAGLQIALAFYMCILQDFQPDTDFVRIRNRLVGIALGIVVTTLVFKYLWPERATDQLRVKLASALRNLARLITCPRPQTSPGTTIVEAGALRSETSEYLDQILRLSELAAFEDDEDGPPDRISVSAMKAVVSKTQGVFLTASLLSSETGLSEWERLPEPAQRAESKLRGAVAAELDHAAASLMDGELPVHIAIEDLLRGWNRFVSALPPGTTDRHRDGLLRRLVTQVGQL